MNTRMPIAALALLLSNACASAPRALRMEPLAFSRGGEDAAAAPRPALLVDDHFVTDRAGGLSEDQLREILKAPVFLEAASRVGIVPVVDGYGADEAAPLSNVTGALAHALEASGQFEIVSEVSTDFPATGSVAGLRELAARYRCDYLLLYRHRFVDAVRPSGWAWAWATLLLPLAVPVNTLESEGVLEATLFDTKTGTILFTTFERTKGKKDESVLDLEHKQKELKEKLLADATKALADGVVSQISRLAASRTAYDALADATGEKAARLEP